MSLVVQLWKNTSLFPKSKNEAETFRYFAEQTGGGAVEAISPYGLGVNLYASLPLSVREVVPDFIDAQSGRRTDSKLGVIARAPLTAEEIREVVQGYLRVREG